MAKKVAGLDLSALASEISNLSDAKPAGSGAANRIALDLIEPDPAQPRKFFDEQKLSELADSIKERGVLQPIVVTERDESGKYRIIMGERRWRASRLAGKADIPALVRIESADLFDQMIENIQREDLAHSDIARMIIEQIQNGMKARALAKTLGKHESWVSRYRNFFDLPAIIRERIDEIGMVTASLLHKAYVEDEEATIVFMETNDVITRKMTEEFAKNLSAPPPAAFVRDPAPETPTFDENAISPFAEQAGAGEGRGPKPSGNGSSESEADYGIGESSKPPAAKKAKYAAFVSVKKKPGELGRLLTDRLASKGEEYAAISFEGEVLEFPAKEIKFVAISPVE